MSNRRRSNRKPQSYAGRIQRRSVGRPPRRWPAWLRPWQRAPWLPAVLAVTAEAGHLVAAFAEWPDSTTRGVYHILAAALLGLVAATVRTGSDRLLLAAGAAVALTGPALWLGGTLLGTSTYDSSPVPVAAATPVGEVALVALLVAAWLAAPRSHPAAAPTRTAATAKTGS